MLQFCLSLPTLPMAMISRKLVIAVPVLLACAGCINRTPAVKEVPAPVIAANPTPVRMAPVPTADWKAMVAPEPTSRMEVAPTVKPVISKGSSGPISSDGALITGKFVWTSQEDEYMKKSRSWMSRVTETFTQEDGSPEWVARVNIHLGIGEIKLEHSLTVPPPDFAEYHKLMGQMLKDLEAFSDPKTSKTEAVSDWEAAKRDAAAMDAEKINIEKRWTKIPTRIKP